MLEFLEGFHKYYVYIITNKNKTTFYIGVTNNLKRHLEEHKEEINSNSFSSKYRS